MEIKVLENSVQLGKEAAKQAAETAKKAIASRGKVRIVLSTGTSQFDFIKAFVQSDLDWSKVEMFHLDEYVGLPENHPASFRKYLRERFVNLVSLGNAFFVNGEWNVVGNIGKLSEEIRKEPIDLALIGIGENAHIGFNDPPADFVTKEAYIVVELDESCKKQQVGEGWFASLDDVPKQAITMTVHQIMQSEVIISCVPHEVKAKAIKLTMANDPTEHVPATVLKTHPNWTLYLDQKSAALIDSASMGK